MLKEVADVTIIEKELDVDGPDSSAEEVEEEIPKLRAKRIRGIPNG